MFEVLMVLPHVVFGVLGIVSAVWALVELLNVSSKNMQRLRISSILTSIFIWLSYVAGGWWYVKYYAADKAKINAGAFPAAHTFFMEAKEHVFFILLLLSIFLPVIVFKNDLVSNKNIKKLAITVAVIIILLGFGMEGAGSMIVSGVKIGLLGGK